MVPIVSLTCVPETQTRLLAFLDGRVRVDLAPAVAADVPGRTPLDGTLPIRRVVGLRKRMNQPLFLER
jgi:hypothetical protein